MTMAEERKPFKKGDKVRLKGNPRILVVEQVGGLEYEGVSESAGPNAVCCVWLERGKKGSDWFDPVTLELVPEPTPRQNVIRVFRR